MYAQLLGFLLLACQIIFNKSHTIIEVTDSASQINVTSTPARLPEGYVSFPDVHAAYKIHKEGNHTWSEASDVCVAEGGHLAITDTSEKIAHINSMQTRINTWIRTGIRKSSTTGEWIRSDNGLPLAFIPWHSNNPDGSGDCAIISLTADLLIDLPCDWGKDWCVCEIPI